MPSRRAILPIRPSPIRVIGQALSISRPVFEEVGLGQGWGRLTLTSSGGRLETCKGEGATSGVNGGSEAQGVVGGKSHSTSLYLVQLFTGRSAPQ